MIANGKKEIVGFKRLQKGSNLEVLDIRIIPKDAFVALVPECFKPNSIIQGSWNWYPVSGLALSTMQPEAPNWYFDQDNLKLILSDDLQQVSIYNVSGKLIKVFENVESTIDLDDFPSGCYFVRSSNNFGLSTIKILIP